ncbi:MAG: AAA family ATPase [Acidobacteria bacterium]|nr:AAA family ATPase [Acidobacteriota bacterium]
MQTVVLEGVEVALAPADEVPALWVGQEDLVRQLLASWMVLAPEDLPLNPRLVGRPGVGKTTLACAAAARLGREVYLFQATADTRPDDLILTPVLGEGGTIRYVASTIVSAMVRGGVAVLDEGNRMSEKAWASLAPLLDQRRYVESIVAGIKIRAHAEFRFCTTMNDDASTYDLPEYISSRLLPRITVDFPEAEEELRILAANLPFAPGDLLRYVVAFLQTAHERDAAYSVRDGINVARYALKRAHQEQKPPEGARELLREATEMVLGSDALEFLPPEEG